MLPCTVVDASTNNSQHKNMLPLQLGLVYRPSNC